MEVFRLARAAYKNKLDGKGAAIKGARWNSAGVEIIYTAANRSLAIAEVFVHLTAATLPVDFYMLTIYIPDDVSMIKMSSSQLPFEWNRFPHPSSTQQIGNTFIRAAKHSVLQIPSAVIAGDFNYLINPNHAEFSKVHIIESARFMFDNRFFN